MVEPLFKDHQNYVRRFTELPVSEVNASLFLVGTVQKFRNRLKTSHNKKRDSAQFENTIVVPEHQSISYCKEWVSAMSLGDFKAVF
jgi:hypothetical protein